MKTDSLAVPATYQLRHELKDQASSEFASTEIETRFDGRSVEIEFTEPLAAENIHLEIRLQGGQAALIRWRRGHDGAPLAQTTFLN